MQGLQTAKVIAAILVGLVAWGCERESDTAAAPPSADPVAAPEKVRDSDAGLSKDLPSAYVAGGEAVGYYNPDTGYSADYTLEVDRDPDGTVTCIHFPNGGYEDDFVDQTDNGDGTVTATDEDGREFTVATSEDDALGGGAADDDSDDSSGDSDTESGTDPDE